MILYTYNAIITTEYIFTVGDQMKKYALRITAFLIALMLIFPINAYASSVPAGDIDLDGRVTAADARLALRFSVGLESFSPEQEIISDIDKSGKTEAGDARLILRMSVGLEEIFYVDLEETESFFEVHFIDVGQADCSLIICDGDAMLIDGGNTGDSSLITDYLINSGITELDYIICTHAHEDHVGGLGDILNEFTVTEAIFAPETGADTKCYKEFVDAANTQNKEITVPEVGSEIALGSSTVTFISPLREDYSDINDTSIVAKITYGETSFLFTGDAEREAEQDILASGADISADVLKVGHHGSENSTTYPFLREIMPDIAVISVGTDNKYGHPTEEALSRLRDADVQVLRTDMQGHIVITSDRKNLTVSTEKNQNAETNPTNPSQPANPDEPTIPDTPDANTEYVGNINSKKLHLPSCSSLPKEENRIYFATKEAAINEGFTACSRCKPF